MGTDIIYVIYIYLHILHFCMGCQIYIERMFLYHLYSLQHYTDCMVC